MTLKAIANVLAAVLCAIAIWGGYECWCLRSIQLHRAELDVHLPVAHAINLDRGVTANPPASDSKREKESDATSPTNAPGVSKNLQSKMIGASIAFAPMYRDLLASGAATPGQVEKLSQLLQQRELALTDTVDSARKMGIENDSQEMKDALIAADVQFDLEIDQQIGAEIGAKYRTFRSQFTQFTTVERVAALARAAGIPLGSADRSEMIDALSDQPAHTGDYSRFTSSDQFTGATISESALARLQNVIGAAQFELLKRARDEEETLSRLRQVFYGPSSTKNRQ